MDALKAGIQQAKGDFEPSAIPDWLKQDRFKEKNGRDVFRLDDKNIEPDKD